MPVRDVLQLLVLLAPPSPFPFLPFRRFRFLSIFKWEPRKGWDILLRAYLTAFTPVDDVCLVIHTEPYHSNTPIADEIDRVAAEVLAESSNVEADTATASQRARPCIEVLTEHIPLRNMPALYAGAHCFVLPSRGEGWGRPHVEVGARHVMSTSFFGGREGYCVGIGRKTGGSTHKRRKRSLSPTPTRPRRQCRWGSLSSRPTGAARRPS